MLHQWAAPCHTFKAWSMYKHTDRFMGSINMTGKSMMFGLGWIHLTSCCRGEHTHEVK